MYTITYIRASRVRAIATPSLSVFIDTLSALRAAGLKPRGWEKDGKPVARA